ncbi:MAG: thiamine pyrophosphate-binding protein [Rhizobiaceae bacterium]
MKTCASLKERSGGEILVDQLEIHGVTTAFGIPGESYLAVLDALHDSSIDFVVCRNEAGATMMAEATGKLTGQPGVVFVTRGPGASNAFPGVHIAQQDSSPLVVFVGQVERACRGRDTFQELDYRAVFGSVAKWVVEIDDAARIPELVARAFLVARSGRPGPVVVALPEDMLVDRCVVADGRACVVAEGILGLAEAQQLTAMLNDASRPVAVLGGSRWSRLAVDQMAEFAERARIPVYCSFRRQMLFPATHPCYGGDLGLGANPDILDAVSGSDLLLLIGGRFSEVPSQGYSLVQHPVPQMPLVHIHPGVDEIGRVFAPVLGLALSPEAFCAGLAVLDIAAPSDERSLRVEQAHSSFIRWSDPSSIVVPGKLQMGEVMTRLRDLLPDRSILCNGAGNYATWLHRFWHFQGFGTQLAPTSGSMGYGVPAAVAAKKLHPDRCVVAFSGDGCFLMNGQEFATAVQYDLPIIVVLVDNGMYGTIRMHQEREYPGRVSGTALRNPDFAHYARSFGGHGETVRSTDEFAPAFARCVESGKPSILHCMLDPEALTPARSLSQIREAARAS